MSSTWIMLLALASASLAQPRDAARVQAGEDLAAWRAIQASDAQDPEALKDFIEDFPSSPLAELAYRNLGALQAELSPSNQLSRLSASYERHQADLQRRPTHVVVATLSVHTDPAAFSSTTAWSAPVWGVVHPVVEGGVGFGPGLYIGGGAEIGPLTLTARGEFFEIPDLSAALRYTPITGMWRPFFELQGTALHPRLTGSLGLRRDLSEGYAIELSGGAGWGFEDRAFVPAARIGVIYSL